jgi:hypothetical protein
MEFIKKWREGNKKGSIVSIHGICWQREHASLLQVLLKLTLIYEKE